MKKISVLVLSQDAQESLDATLDSLVGFDEVILIDNNSTDSTWQIAEKRGIRVVQRRVSPDNPTIPNRNALLDIARHEWVLIIGGKETVPEKLKNYLYDFVQNPGNVAGIYIPCKKFMFNSFMRNSYPGYRLRFFNRTKSCLPPWRDTDAQVKGDVIKIPAEDEDMAIICHLSSCKGAIDKMNADLAQPLDGPSPLRTMLWAPLGRFMKVMIVDGMWRHGRAGIMQSMMEAQCRFMTLANNYEHSKKAEPEKKRQ